MAALSILAAPSGKGGCGSTLPPSQPADGFLLAGQNRHARHSQIVKRNAELTNYVVTGTGTPKTLSSNDILTVTPNGVIADLGSAVTVSGSLVTILNSGTLAASNGSGIAAIGGSCSIQNSGMIAGSSGISISDGIHGGGAAHILNTGTISGHGLQGIYVSAGDSLIENAGSISAINGTAIEINSALPGEFRNLTNLITNSGQITATSHSRDAQAIILWADDDTVVNSGTIRGSVAFGTGTNLLNNTGWIIGAVSFDAGNDTVINHGTLDGIVNLGDGTNTFDGRGGTILGYVQGGAGSDLYRISDGAIVLIEGAGDPDSVDSVQTTASFKLPENFEILQLMGNEAINGSGSSTLNVIYGNSADNRLSGLGGNDNLFGDEGDDRLLGGLGNDQLYGFDDDDNLRGGFGADTLTGGDGADSFVFQTRFDSANATADRIADFAQGVDLIDLGGLPGTLTFRGTGAFQAGGPQLRIVQGATTQVQIDLDGDLSADMKILLTGNIALQATDFIL
jgi:Ca2+-binding RTX toxin-like protein